MKDYAGMSDCEIAIQIGKAIGLDDMAGDFYAKNGVWTRFDPCNNPADAWPILLENKISLNYMVSESAWCAHVDGLMTDGCWCWDIDPEHYHDHANPLRAGMIVFLMMKESEK